MNDICWGGSSSGCSGIGIIRKRQIRTQATGKGRILLVDDDCDERQLFAHALQMSGVEAELFEAADGHTAINYLLGLGQYADRMKFPFPDAVVLDLKMPTMHGFELLKKIRMDMGLQNLPVIVLTNSNSGRDIAVAYSSSASAFHQKPFGHDDLVKLLKKIIPLWLSTPGSSTGTTEIRPSWGD